MARIEHFNDPDAPRANSIVVATTAFVLDERGCVLLQRRTDNGLWALPGGAQDLGETLAESAVREVAEETGIGVEVVDVVRARRQIENCWPVGGALRTSAESSDVRWVQREELEALPIHESMRLRIDHGFEDRPKPYIG